jgi:hypothetical protein
MQPQGWSARVMFRDGGTVHTYTYCQNKKQKYGIDGRHVRRFKFGRNRYYAVSLHIKLNEPAKKENGFSHLYIDGEPVVIQDEIRFRGVDSEDTLIQKFMFSTFHGGHQPSWAPKDKKGNYVMVYASFDNFAVFRGKQIRKKPGATW